MLKVLLKRKVLFIYIPLAIHWVSIFVLTSLPTKSMPSFALHDKVKHFIAYLVLTFFLSLTLRVQDKYAKIKEEFIKYTIIITLLYSTFDEIHQIFIPGRSAEVLDWIANLFGIFLGITLVRWLLRKSGYDKMERIGTEI